MSWRTVATVFSANSCVILPCTFCQLDLRVLNLKGKVTSVPVVWVQVQFSCSPSLCCFSALSPLCSAYCVETFGYRECKASFSNALCAGGSCSRELNKGLLLTLTACVGDRRSGALLAWVSFEQGFFNYMPGHFSFCHLRHVIPFFLTLLTFPNWCVVLLANESLPK